MAMPGRLQLADWKGSSGRSLLMARKMDFFFLAAGLARKGKGTAFFFASSMTAARLLFTFALLRSMKCRQRGHLGLDCLQTSFRQERQI